MATKTSRVFKKGLIMGLSTGILLSIAAATAILKYTVVELVIKQKPNYEELKLDVPTSKPSLLISGERMWANKGGKNVDLNTALRRVHYH